MPNAYYWLQGGREGGQKSQKPAYVIYGCSLNDCRVNLQIVHKIKCPYGITFIKENVHRKWNVHTTHWIEEWPYKIYLIGKCRYVWKRSIILDTLYLVEYTTEIFESWSFIANTTGKKVLSLNEYSKVFYQNPQSMNGF